MPISRQPAVLQIAGSSVAIDNATPCTLSASAQTFTLDNGDAGTNGAAAGAYFSLYKNPDNSKASRDSRSYLNWQTDIKRYGTDDAGSAWMIDETTISAPFVSASEGKIYKIKAYFSDSDDLYFTNDGTNLAFNTSASGGVNDYWILRSSGNGDYPWRFESGRGDGKFLSGKNGLSNTGVYLQINTYNTLFDLRGSKDGDAYTSGIVNLGTWNGVDKTGFGAYGDGGCWGSTGHNTSGTWTTEYTIEEVTGVSIYTVVSNINAGGVTKTVYTGKAEQTNGGFYILSSTPSASDFTAISVDGYTAGDIVVDVTAKTISVNYTANITYTLKDTNGATYSWSASGTFGTAPTITGCYGITISNEVWNEESRTYTADISFPFPISSNEVINWKYIGSFNVSGYADPNNFCWYVKSDDNKVYIKKYTLPTNEDGENEKFKWAIFPTNSNNQFSFKIKNESTGKFLYAAKEEAGHTGEEITLSETGTGFAYIYGQVPGTSVNVQGWKIPSKNLYVSDGSSGDSEQKLGLWDAIHRGIAVGFLEPTDFTPLMANLKTAYTSFNQYLPPFNSGTYTETVEGKMLDTYATYNATTTNVIKDNPTAYLTASDFQKYTNAYNTAINGLQASIDENTFIRIRSMMSSDLINTPTYLSSEDKIIGGYHNCMFTQDNKKLIGKETIFYYDSDKHIIAFSNGNWLFDDAGYAEWNTSIDHNKLNAEFDNVNIKFLHNSTNKYVYTKSDANGIYLDTDGSINSHEHNFLIEPVTSLPVTLKASALGYATFCCPVPVKIPSGVEAFVSKIEDNTIKLFRIENFKDASDNVVIPANTAVMLHNKNFSSTDETFSFEITEYSEEEITDNGFYGTIAAESMVASDTYYSLRTWKVNDVPTKVGFATKTSGSLAGFKAWIHEEGQSARNFTIVFDSDSDPTGIVEALGLQNDNVEIYDLNGRKLSSYKRGINIVNGKKVMVQ